MIFQPELLLKILLGEKTVTRRSSLWKYRVGGIYAIQPGRGKKGVGKIKIHDVRLEQLKNINSNEAKKEGFHSKNPVNNFLEYWKKIHGFIDMNQKLWRIEFELIEVKEAHTIIRENPDFANYIIKYRYKIENNVPPIESSNYYAFLSKYDLAYTCAECDKDYFPFLLRDHPEYRLSENICLNCFRKKYPRQHFWKVNEK